MIDDYFMRYFFPYFKKYFNVSELTTLDLGCGFGEKTVSFQPFSSCLIGLDIRSECVRAVRNLGVQAIIADATSLPFRDEVFDRVVCFDLVEHVANSLGLLNEVNRVLKKNAILLLTTPNAKRVTSFAAPVSVFFLRIKRRDFPLFNQKKRKNLPFLIKEHIVEYTVTSLENLFKSSLFEV